MVAKHIILAKSAKSASNLEFTLNNTYMSLIGWNISRSRRISRRGRGGSWGRRETCLVGIHIAMSCKGEQYVLR